ncbi:alkaline phosphatase [Pseudovibrio ascidiaceicola]|uniref:alkaline phosphatase n=1 Tax=Pseudovibrio ascidiaceicola TaxID=285279 RepID=UPI000D68CF8B|nr:alkaline phosphatase [Pseudovibrio ascidiaceicola]
MKTPLVALLLACSASYAWAETDFPQKNNRWFEAAEAEIESKLAQQPITKPAKNIILMIADGNGISTNYATRIFQGQQNGLLGEENVLPQETFPHSALVKTYNVNAQTPDSAGTGTAFHSGVKTKAGVLGVDETLNVGDCSAVESASIASIAEVMAAEGKAVGIISTASLTDATPASAYAHVASRRFEDDSDLPEGCDVPDIAAQLIEQIKNGTIDVAFGGGQRHMLPESRKTIEGTAGNRKDGRNLIEEAKALGVSYAWNEASFNNLDPSADKLVLGVFAAGHMQYEYDRKDQPSLADMVKWTIEALQDNENGYYLTVEGGRVDHANHAGNLYRALTDGVAFAEAVAVAKEMTSDQDTLIIVTADHAHTLSFNGYCGRGTPINGLCMAIDNNGVKHTNKMHLMLDGKPYSVASYLNGPGSILTEENNWFGTRSVLSQEEAIDPDFKQQSLLPTPSETHSGEDVAVYARGPWAHLFDGTVEQNYIFNVMNYAASAKER